MYKQKRSIQFVITVVIKLSDSCLAVVRFVNHSYNYKANWTPRILFPLLIIHMKILDSEWLRAMEFKCNNCAKSVTPMQITHRNFGIWSAERKKEIFQANDIP